MSSAQGQHRPVVTIADLHGAGGTVIEPRVAERLGVSFPDLAGVQAGAFTLPLARERGAP